MYLKTQPMKKLFAIFLAVTAFSVSSAIAQEIDQNPPAQDTLTVTVQAAPVVVEEPAAPEMEQAPEIVPAEEIQPEPEPVVEPLPLYTEAPKVDKQIFNHIAAGIPINLPLLPQGIGIIDVATTLTPYLQFRLGYTLPLLSVSSFTINEVSETAKKFNAPVDIPSTVDFNGTQINIGDSKFSFGTSLGGLSLLMDVFPGKKTGFHFTFGAYFNPNCPDSILELSADLSTALKDAGFTPGHYNEFYIGFNDDDPTLRLSPSPDGILKAAIYTGVPIHPYAGIGFGRAIRPDKRVSVVFDMGVIYWGNPVLVGYDYSINANGTLVGFSPERVSKTQDLQSLATPLSILGNVPVYPVMKLGIFIRII